MTERSPALEPGRSLRFPAGLILFALLVAAWKAIALSLEISNSLYLAGRFLALDLTWLAILLAVGTIHALSRPGAWTLLVKAVLFLCVLYYAVHSSVLLELDEYMSIFDLARYLPEWEVVGTFVSPATVAGFVVLLALTAFSIQLGAGHAKRYLLLVLVLLVGGAGMATVSARESARYGFIQVSALTERFGNSGAASVYTVSQLDFYSASQAPGAGIPPDRPDVILVIMESLSTINSKRLSGVNDLLARFDRLSQAGTVFPNFFANHAASEGGIISMLSGFPPLHYPTASPLMFDEFAMQPAVIGEYQAAGYFAEFLTNADLAFIGLDRYVAGLGFDLARGRDEVPSFSGAPQFVQNAPSDRLLYQEALQRASMMAGRDTPWFMAVATVSTHLPYTHPEGGEDSAEAVWDWSLERLEEFHAALVEAGYFEDGILLVTGDHRQMRPVTEAEAERYGVTSRARVPLLAIGKAFTPGFMDRRLLQQSDLLRYLDRLGDRDSPMTAHPVWVERYNRIYGRVESINRFTVFGQQGDQILAWPVRVTGNRLEWPQQRPDFHRSMEARVHAQRSAHQFNRTGNSPSCVAGQAIALASGNEPGWSEFRFEGNVIGRPLADLVPDHSGHASVLGASAEAADKEFTAWYLSFLDIEEAGTYWFRVPVGSRACLSLDGQLVIDQLGNAPMQAPVELEAGTYLVDLRFRQGPGMTTPRLEWVVPGQLRWRWLEVPNRQLSAAKPGG